MGYATGEAAVLAVVRLLSGWDTTNTSRNNWLILNTGAADAYVVLRPGPASFADESIGGMGSIQRTRSRTWRTQVLVYRRYLNDTASPAAIQADVDTLILHLEGYPTMNSSAIQDAQVVGVDALQQINQGDGAPVWLLWPINIDWTETSTQ